MLSKVGVDSQNTSSRYVRAQPGTVPVPAPGCCKVPVPALGEFIPIVAQPSHDHLGLDVELGLDTQFLNGASNASTGSQF